MTSDFMSLRTGDVIDSKVFLLLCHLRITADGITFSLQLVRKTVGFWKFGVLLSIFDTAEPKLPKMS